jgi:hypothetical protein
VTGNEPKFLGVCVSPDAREKAFDVSITGDYRLSVSQIWPDGDAPENPTARDVVMAIRVNCRSAEWLIRDWNLDVDVTVDGIDVVF